MKTAAQSFLLFLLVVVALPTVITSGASGPRGKAEDAGLSPERLQRLSQMIQRRIAAGDLAGAVTVVARKGKVAYVSAQGVMDLESKQPMTEASMFRIASMTKPVAGVATMMMVEEGKLRLNDPVSRYIPEFRGMKVAIQQAPASGSGDETPVFYTVPAQREITVKDLLTHVSGLGSGPMSNSDLAKVARKEGETLVDRTNELYSSHAILRDGSA